MELSISGMRINVEAQRIRNRGILDRFANGASKVIGVDERAATRVFSYFLHHINANGLVGLGWAFIEPEYTTEFGAVRHNVVGRIGTARGRRPRASTG